MIHQCSHRTGAGSREQSLDALVGRMKWRQSWTCRVVSGKLLNCCLAACGHTAGFVFLFFCTFWSFYHCRNKNVEITSFNFAHNCT